jgi:hypothetical protein
MLTSDQAIRELPSMGGLQQPLDQAGQYEVVYEALGAHLFHGLAPLEQIQRM